MPTPAASTKAMMAVPRTYPPRVLTEVAPMRWPRSRLRPLKGRRKNAQMRSPSLRKKNSTTTASRAPVTSSAATETPAIAPLPN